MIANASHLYLQTQNLNLMIYVEFEYFVQWEEYLLL